MSLVMRLEVAASKCDRKVRDTGIWTDYRQDMADMRDLLQEAARKIKELEHKVFELDLKLRPLESFGDSKMRMVMIDKLR